MAPKKTPPEIRFWAKVQKTETCWLWTGGRSASGYGVFYLSKDRKYLPAHCFLAGMAPDGLQWDHLCRVRHCVNPDHLEAVTASENTRRAVDYRPDKTHCAQGHPWIPENIRERQGGRYCKLCEREWNRAKHAANRERDNAKGREYYAANRAACKARARAYYAAHRELKPCRFPGCPNPKTPGKKGSWFCKDHQYLRAD